jgi:ABC-2 type transport system permease protein
MIWSYLAVVSARYRTLLQYRAAALAGLVTQVFWGMIKIMVITAFFAVSDDTQPMSVPQVVSYIWLGQAMLGMLPWSIDRELEQMIKEGGVSYELIRPLDLYGFWFCRTLALRTATTTLRSIPMIIFAVWVLPLFGLADWALSMPPDALSFLVFLISMVAALMLACAVTMLMHVTLVWTISGEGLNRLMPPIVIVFSGMLIPLPLFPDWLQPLLEIQPFRGLVDVPFRIYSGSIAIDAAIPDIIHQCVWALAFVLFGRWLLSRSLKRLVVQGG